jgi:excisionase family DNA binding protein
MPAAETNRRKLTPPQLAKLWGISADKVLAWIQAGELRAIDVSTRRGGRPRWLIDVDDVAAFEVERAAPSRREGKEVLA